MAWQHHGWESRRKFVFIRGIAMPSVGERTETEQLVHNPSADSQAHPDPNPP